jgi:SHS2 domain-containing protein
MGFEVHAATRNELHDEAVKALFEVILDDLGSVRPRRRTAIEVVDAEDPGDLLVRFLSEFLYLHDAHGWLFSGAEVHRVDDHEIVAEGIGEVFDPSRHRIARQVKAVTYHGLSVGQDGSGWSARIVLDL